VSGVHCCQGDRPWGCVAHTAQFSTGVKCSVFTRRRHPVSRIGRGIESSRARPEHTCRTDWEASVVSTLHRLCVSSDLLWEPIALDGCGRLRTPLGDLRIRRLGIRVPPGVPLKTLRCKAFLLSGFAGRLTFGSQSAAASSQQLDESLHGEICLSQGRAQGASRQLATQWDNRRLPRGVPQLQMAAAMTHLGEPHLGQRPHDGAADTTGRPGLTPVCQPAR
jgi:hypothetical protein